jgi:hypothetical protein
MADTRTETVLLDFKANGLDNWDPRSKSVRFEASAKKFFSDTTFKSQFIEYDYKVGIEANAAIFAEAYDFGKLNLQYPINAKFELPKSVSNGENFSIKSLPEFSLGSPKLSGDGFSGGNVGFIIGLKLADFKFDNVKVKDPFDDSRFIPLNVRAFATGFTNEVKYDLFSTEVEQEEDEKGRSILSFKAQQPKTDLRTITSGNSGSSRLLPDINSEGTSNNFLEFSADLDQLIPALKPFNPRIPEVPGPIQVKASIDSISLESSLGLAVKQALLFDATKIDATLMSGGKSDKGSLPDSFDFTAPNSGSGLLDIDATYALDGDIITKTLEVILRATLLKAEFLKGGIKIKVQNKPVFEFSVGPVAGFEVNFDTGSNSFLNFFSSPPSIDITTSNSGKGVEFKNIFQVPFNLPITVEDANVTEGGNLVFVVKQSGNPSQAVTVSYTIQGDSSRVQATSGTITVPQSSSTVITIPTIDNDTQDGTGTVKLILRKSDGTPFAAGVPTIDATGTISDNDAPPPPPNGPGGGSQGDPHLTTFDGLGYSFQGAGEFTLFKSVNNDLNVQVRQEPLGRSPVTVTTAVATILSGQKLGFYPADANPLRVNGTPVSLADKKSITVGTGKVFRDGSSYIVVYPTGDQLRLNDRGSFADLLPSLTTSRSGQIRGLLGNANSNTRDDIALATGEVLPAPVSSSDLYGKYADSWRITQAESLFDYLPGQSTNTFTVKNFPVKQPSVADLNPVLVAQARAQVIASGITNPVLIDSAILDLVLSNFDQAFLQSAQGARAASGALAVDAQFRASDDFSITPANTPVTISVLNNDISASGRPLSVTLSLSLTSNKGGKLALQGNQVVYTPPNNFTGFDKFNYTLSDGTLRDNAEVNIQITTINFNSLNGTTGFTFKGNSGSFSGFSTSGIGDFNGDGIRDLAVGGFLAKPNGVTGAGETYLIYGKRGDFSPNLEASQLNGLNGFTIKGLDQEGTLGTSIAGADINGDGLADLIVGSPGSDSNGKKDAGRTYVIFGNPSNFSTFSLSSLNGRNGFSITGANPSDLLGVSVAGADLNKDSFADLIVAAPGSGKAYLIYGKSGGFSPTIDLAQSGITTINDSQQSSALGVKGIGDINGDGVEDFAVTAARVDQAGEDTFADLYLIFGKSGSQIPNLNLGSLSPSDGIRIQGSLDLGSSVSVSKVGDFNGDSIDDIVIGYAGNTTTSSGKSFVVFGSRTNIPTNLSTLNGTNGFGITDNINGDLTGVEVSAGDFNGDRLADIVIGSSGHDQVGKTNTGRTYVILGKRGAFPTLFNLSSINGENGLIIEGSDQNDQAGVSVSSVGDINGDTVDDLVIGAPGDFFSGSSGKTFAVFGSKAIASGARSSEGVIERTAGNGNLILGTNTNNLIFGNSPSSGINDTIAGFAGDDQIFGLTGNDSIDGGFGNDEIYGGIGNDTLLGNIGNDTLIGSQIGATTDIDILVGGGGADIFVLATTQNNFYAGANDYAIIQDFSRQDGDKILVRGLIDLDPIGSAALPSGVADGVTISANRNLIAVVRGVSSSALSFANDFLEA